MLDLISWYVVELQTRLAPYLPSSQVDTIVSEAESHLRISAQRIFENQECSNEESASGAIAAFGSPEKVALTYLRQNAWRPMGIAPIWLVVGGALVASITWILNFLWLRGPFDNMGEVWQNGVAGFVGLVALFAFCLGCYAGRRSFRIPILILSAGLPLATVGLLSYLAVSGTSYDLVISRLHLKEQTTNIENEIPKLDRMEAYLRQGMHLYTTAKSGADIPESFRGIISAQRQIGILAPSPYLHGALDSVDTNSESKASQIEHYLAPNGYVFADLKGNVDGIYPVGPSFEGAVKQWRENGEQAIASIPSQKVAIRDLLVSAHQAQSGRLFFFRPAGFGDALGFLVMILPVFFLLDTAIFAWVKRRRQFPRLVRT